MISARSGRTEVTDILLTGDNIDPDIQENVRPQTTPLIIGQHNIYIPSSQITGWSALFFSAKRGDVTTTKSLLKARANVHLKDKVCDKLSFSFYLIHLSINVSSIISFLPVTLLIPYPPPTPPRMV